MTSSSIRMDKRRRTYVRLIGEIRHALNQALSEEHERRGLTQADMARALGRNRSFISRALNGTGNMTLETLADLAYALDRPVRMELPARGTDRVHLLHGSGFRETAGNTVIPLPRASEPSATAARVPTPMPMRWRGAAC